MVTSFSDSVTIRSDRAFISCYQLFQMRRTDVTTAEESNANVYSNSVIYSGTVFITLIIIYEDIFGKSTPDKNKSYALSKHSHIK